MQTEKRISLCISEKYLEKIKILNKYLHKGVLQDGTFLKKVCYDAIDNEIKKHKELFKSDGVFSEQRNLFKNGKTAAGKARKIKKSTK